MSEVEGPWWLRMKVDIVASVDIVKAQRNGRVVRPPSLS